MRAIVTLAVLALFAALLWYGLAGEARVECDACFAYRGRTECRTGAGDSRESALDSANTAACAVLGSGVTDAMRCSASPPSAVSCRALSE